MAPRVLISDALSPAAVQIFKDRGVEVDFQPNLGKDKDKLADIINGVGIGVILLTVAQSTVSLHLYSVRGNEALSRTFDRLSFVIILPCYVLLNIALPLAAKS